MTHPYVAIGSGYISDCPWASDFGGAGIRDGPGVKLRVHGRTSKGLGRMARRQNCFASPVTGLAEPHRHAAEEY